MLLLDMRAGQTSPEGSKTMTTIDKTTKKEVRSDFKHARYLMRLAEEAMRNNESDWADAEVIANELVACAATFAQYVEEQQEETA